MTVRRLLALGGLMLAILVAAQPVLAGSVKQSALANGTISRISVGSNGMGGGSYAAISANGKFVTFESAAADLVPGQNQDSWDTLVRDQLTGTIERDSIRSDGTTVYNPGAYTSSPAISADGRLVAFNSEATTLVSNDKNGMPDIFVHDRTTHTTELISVGLDGKSGNADSYTPAISADGRYVAFQSFASNLVSGDTNNVMDVFVRDRETGKTELVSITDTGQQGTDPHDYGFPGVAISGDGRYVVFSYQNLPVRGAPDAGPNIYLRDRETKTTRFIAQGTLPAISSDGQFITFVTSAALVSSDTNTGPDVYLYNVKTSQFERISIPNGTEETSNANIESPASLSANGQYVAFETTAQLVPADTNNVSDIYLRDRLNNTTALISTALNSHGMAGNNASHSPSISADGTTIAFNSLADNLVTGDTNGVGDVFVFTTAQLIVRADPVTIYLPVMSR